MAWPGKRRCFRKHRDQRHGACERLVDAQRPLVDECWICGNVGLEVHIEVHCRSSKMRCKWLQCRNTHTIHIVLKSTGDVANVSGTGLATIRQLGYPMALIGAKDKPLRPRSGLRRSNLDPFDPLQININ